MAHRLVRTLGGGKFFAAACSAAVLLSACSGAQTSDDKVGQELMAIANTPASAEAPPPPAAKASGDDDKLTKDQKDQMEIALRRGGEKAANCSLVVTDGPSGEGEVTVTFDGDKGRVTDVAVGAPFAGTSVELCIKRAFLNEIVVPFAGSLDVPYPVKLPKRGGDAPTDKDKTKKGDKKK